MSTQIRNFSDIFLISWDPKSQVVRPLVRQLVYQVCYTRYQVLFYLWWIRSLLKYCKVPKYYDQDCRILVEFSLTCVSLNGVQIPGKYTESLHFYSWPSPPLKTPGRMFWKSVSLKTKGVEETLIHFIKIQSEKYEDDLEH